MSIKLRDQILLVFLAFFLRCLSTSHAVLRKDFDLPFDLDSVVDNVNSLPDPAPTTYIPNDISQSSEIFTKFLLTPWPKGMSPFLYIEKPGSINEYLEKEPLSINELDGDSVVRPVGSKRSKYYRKYPWKRQQANIRVLDSFRGDSMKSRSFIESGEILRPNQPKRGKRYRKCPSWKRHQKNVRYEPAYMCIPGKDDIYRLLVALHGERDGPRGQLVDFCNRKRPASFVFTNIRYVG
ncbi:uncharacterized protein LOC126743887 isoform X1 [Anthonomus grandis grandis]|uniref:uncharacterized protein LOC126743887 isoform X1 n=1 Tax=Anthonomus grandis grandis TaxID=2921223 RepID=UPI0021656817|nr:uncharacterized protein LOC126743887 isoform X1 [Anthonomus grandis grandis]